MNNTSRKQAPKGSVQIRSNNNRLQLIFSFGGKRHILSLGLSDTPLNRKIAEKEAKTIELDMLTKQFDFTLAKYKSQSSLALIESPPQIKAKPELELDALWEKYTIFKTPQIAPSTLKSFRFFENCIQTFPSKKLEDAVMIRDYLFSTHSKEMVRRILVQLNACCKWGLKSKLISFNPFANFPNEIKKSKKGENEYFTSSERDLILETFLNHPKGNHYYPFLKFLFLTGCRPSEAIALKINSISSDKKFIYFTHAVTNSPEGLIIKEGLKTQEKRKFPCNPLLQSLLESIISPDLDPERLLFPSPKGKFIDFHNFNNRIWKPILKSLPIPYRKPYCTRSTFITLALENGLDAKDVARLCGTSASIIYQNYSGVMHNLQVPEF